MQLKITALIGDKAANAMMRHFDIRDTGKLYCRSVNLTATLDGTKTPEAVFDGLLAALRREYAVAFVRSTSHSLRWRNQDVKTVSDGNRFFLLDALDR